MFIAPYFHSDAYDNQCNEYVFPYQSNSLYNLLQGRGLTGLKNLGNTCYMNSILQCLSNTPQLREYCVSDMYKTNISRRNKTNGQVIEEVAALLKELWNGQYKCVASRDLRVSWMLQINCEQLLNVYIYVFRKLWGNIRKSFAASINKTRTNSSPYSWIGFIPICKQCPCRASVRSTRQQRRPGLSLPSRRRALYCIYSMAKSRVR